MPAMILPSFLRYRRALTHATSFPAVRTLSVAVMFIGLSVACSAELPKVRMVEEGWSMAINEPDPNSYSPQVTFLMSPSADNENTYFQLQMNYAADEGFSGGGFHVAAVNDAHIVDEERSQTKRALSTMHDHVRWTSVMAVIDDKLYYAVKDGHSDDWGTFGGPEYLVEMTTALSDLSGYSVNQSLDTVDVGFNEPESDDTIGILPIALDLPSWEDAVNGLSDDDYDFSGSVSNGSDGVSETNLYPKGTGAPGNRGTVDIGGANNSTADLSRQILHAGETDSDSRQSRGGPHCDSADG